ncbi:MAG: DnaJ domain-containing protein [Bryobacterales bacterium]|nr:DnaJ domain-containing protein [Bryobacterales bacterium]
MPEQEFVDYYELFQINSSAEPEAIQRVYRVLAARYHPDNTETGNIEKFLLIKEGYQILSDPAKRLEYDKQFDQQKQAPLPIFMTKEFVDGVDGESNRRMGVLCLLYSQRKNNPPQPALSVLELENMMFVPREHLVFTIWYLKSKRFIQSDDRSSLMITADGIDYLEANLPTHKSIHKLLRAAETGASRQTHFETGWAEKNQQ